MRLENQDRTLANIAFVIAFDAVLSWLHCITMLRKFGLFSSCCGKGGRCGYGGAGREKCSVTRQWKRPALLKRIFILLPCPTFSTRRHKINTHSGVLWYNKGKSMNHAQTTKHVKGTAIYRLLESFKVDIL
jgi:hypothetical protein